MEFDISFEEDVLAQCLKDTEYLRTATPLLQAHHFTSPPHGWLWKTVSEIWRKFSERPVPRILLASAARDFSDDEDVRRTHLELVSRLFKYETETPRASLDELGRFVRHCNIQEAMRKSIESLEKGKTDDAYEPLRLLMREDLRPRSYKMAKWMEEFEVRQSERKRLKEHPEEIRAIPTGIKRLDGIITGLVPSEVGLIVGTTGRGKSIFATHIGYQGILHGKGVLYISLEMGISSVASRFDSRFTGMLHRKLKKYDLSDEDLRTIKGKLDKMKERLTNKLRIIALPPRTLDPVMLRDIVRENAAEMPVDMVIVDSGDHMIGASKGYKDFRFEAADIYWGLKTLATDDDMAVWSTTQAGSQYENRTAGAEAVSESYDKARISDLVLTLNKPEAKSRSTPVVDDDSGTGVSDYKPAEPSLPTLELYLAKYRDGESKVRIPLTTDFSRMLITEAEKETGPGGF